MTESIFSFFLSKEKNTTEYPFEKSCAIGGYNLLTDAKTPLDYYKKDNRELIIFGYAVDVFNGQSKNLAETILTNTNNFTEVIEQEKQLGGKYVIFYADENGVCCMGDATCSVPIFYSVGLPVICCSNPNFIVKAFGIKKDDKLLKIRESGPLGQAMPFDITAYKEIKQLIPNHYYNLTEQKKVRFINSFKKQKKISVEEAVKITLPMVEKMTEYYLSKFDVYCPLTGGRDSRVIYALLKKLCNNVNSYTIWLDHLKSDKQDWDIPVEVVKQGNTNHEQLELIEVSEEEKRSMDDLLGENNYPFEAFALSLTIKKNYPNVAVIEGDILGQISQCHVHRDVPAFLASPRYFRCKVHNYSKDTVKLMKAWMKEIQQSDEQVNILDLFCVENRLGIWASYTHLLRNLVGQVNLNNFNSRNLIYVWTAVSSKDRSKALINLELIKATYPQTLNIPFGQDGGFVKLAKKNGLTYYMATFLKYYLEKRKFYKN